MVKIWFVKYYKSIILIGGCFIAFFYFYQPSYLQTIRFGQTAPLSGSASNLGIDMMQGANAYFRYVNEQGGVKGKKIELISLDDKYEPNLAAFNTKKLIKDFHVFGIFGVVGTPTARKSLAIALESKIPFLTPFTGAKFLREPVNPYIINLRTSYEQETESLVKYLIDVKKVNKIAVFYQNDAFGVEGLYGVKKALNHYNKKLLVSSTYNRNTLSVGNALYEIKRCQPEAIIMIGAYKPCSEFMERGRRLGLDKTLFCATSFTGVHNLIQSTQSMKGVMVSQVLPNCSSSHPLIGLYHKIYRLYYPKSEISSVSLEGFLSAYFVVELLKNVQGELTVQRFIEASLEFPFNGFDGFTSHLNALNREVLNDVYIQEFSDNEHYILTKVH